MMPLLASALSGLAWAGIAYLLAARHLGWVIWGGMYAAPLIGLAAGMASRGFRRRSWWVRAFIALVSLYSTAALFGIANGLYEVIVLTSSGRGSFIIPGGVVEQSVAVVLWGLTIMGYALMLWPLAYLNHVAIATVWDKVRARQED